MRDNLDGGELHPTVDDRRRCKKNSLSALSYICKKTKEGSNRGSKVGRDSLQRRARRGKFQFLLRNREGLAKEKVVRDFVSTWNGGCVLALQ